MAIVVRLQHHHIHLILNLQNENKNKMLNRLSFLSENDDRFRYMDNAPFPGTQPVAGPAGKKCDNRTKQHMANLPSHRPFF